MFEDKYKKLRSTSSNAVPKPPKYGFNVKSEKKLNDGRNRVNRAKNDLTELQNNSRPLPEKTPLFGDVGSNANWGKRGDGSYGTR